MSPGRASEREIVRRWTGGGVVPHGADLTYSVIIPARHPFFALSSLKIYSDLHEAISVAMKAIGVEASLADSASPKISENCFANAVRADVISRGPKNCRRRASTHPRRAAAPGKHSTR